MKIISKLTNFIILLRCAFILFYRSVIILFRSMKKNLSRDFINNICREGGIKILETAKVKFDINFINKALFSAENHYIFMSNHQSLFDVPLIYASIPGTIRPVTKTELFRIPIFGKALHAGECIPISRSGNLENRMKFMQIAKQKFLSGVSIWIFPEGTRSGNSELLPFKSGGFYLAKEIGAKIIPVGILNTNAILPARSLSLSLNQSVSINIGEPIDAEHFSTPKELKNTVRNAIEHLLKLNRHSN